MTLDWQRSPVYGSKPLWRAFDGGVWQASIVWNRGEKAYAIEVATVLANNVRTGRLIGYVNTVPQAKKAVLWHLESGLEA